MRLQKCYNKSIIKLIWLQHKKVVLLLALAILFIVVLFFLKNKTVFENQGNQINQEGLAYGNETLENLINKDTDGDGVLDWEENLWGMDPMKKDTNDDGVSDNVEVAKIKSASGANTTAGSGEGTKTLTETDKFSRELFSTIATLSQAGEMDQASIDKLSNSLVEQIKNPPIEKVFTFSDLKIAPNENLQTVKSYSDTLNILFSKTKTASSRTVMDILADLIVDEENIDTSVLSELDPIIDQAEKIVNEMLVVGVPESLASSHLDVVNAFQRLLENLNNLKLFDDDVVVALGAISQYQTNTDTMVEAMTNLNNAIKQKLNN